MTICTNINQVVRTEVNKIQVETAQIGEITKLTLTILANLPIDEVTALLEHYKFQRRVHSPIVARVAL